MPVDPRLHAADTVTVFVHGVGAHDAQDMAVTAEKGFWRIDGSRGADTRTCDLRVDLGCGAPGPREQPNAFSIRAGGETHVVVPVVWCDFRSRIVRHERKDGLLRTLSDTPAGPLLNLRRAVPRLLDICFDALQCARTAAKPAQRVLLTSIVALLVMAAGAACLLVIAAVVVPLVLSLSIFGTLPSDLFSDGIVLAFAVFAVLTLAAAAKVVLSPYDYIGDVASWVASDRFREAAIGQFKAVLQRIAAQAPRAQILVVGHSLGSVLVSHALLESPLQDGRRPVLVTLGSPLGRMSRWFAHIASPQRLLLAYRDRGLVERWYHFWRDGDYVGRSLMPNRSDDLYAEKALGPGGHANYWDDVHLWRELVAVVRDQLARRDLRTKAG
jgi:hypothetical protein